MMICMYDKERIFCLSQFSQAHPSSSIMMDGGLRKKRDREKKKSVAFSF